MVMRPRTRKLALTAHVTSSVGWLGAVACFVALSTIPLVHDDVLVVRAAYLAMEAAAWYVLVPLSIASLATGLLQSLGTPWGLFRHYWVIAKLTINVFATVVLVLYTETLGYFADEARAQTAGSGDLGVLRNPSPLLHAGAALLLLVIATGLSIYKPKGMTRHGQRRPRRAGSAEHDTTVARPPATVP
jgi:hypothetical protein